MKSFCERTELAKKTTSKVFSVTFEPKVNLSREFVLVAFDSWNIQTMKTGIPLRIFCINTMFLRFQEALDWQNLVFLFYF